MSGRNRNRLAEFIFWRNRKRDLRKQIPFRAKTPEAAWVGLGARSELVLRRVREGTVRPVRTMFTLFGLVIVGGVVAYTLTGLIG